MSNTRAMNILKLIKITNSSKKYRKLSADAAARRGRRAIAQAKLVKMREDGRISSFKKMLNTINEECR